VRLRRHRGQSAVELALVAPVLVGLFALALQGGLIVSDQVNLEHYATEAAQWAVTHPDIASPDGGLPGTITQHIYEQMCDGALAPPSSIGARYCNGPLTSSATVTVTSRSTPVSSGPLGPIRVLAASTCTANNWSVSVSPSTATADLAGSGTAHFAATLTTSGSGNNPAVSLTVASKPVTFLTPYFSAPDVSANSTTSGVDITAQKSTTNGAKRIKLSATDQCGLVRYFTVTVVVVNSTATAPSACPSATPSIVGPDLTVISNAATTVLTITGANFQNGATVTINAITATLVNVISSNQIVATIPSGLPTGVYDLTITNPNTCVATADSAVTIVTSANGGNFGGVCSGAGCPGSGGNNGGIGQGGGMPAGGLGTVPGSGGPPPATAQNACAPTGANYQMLITITWSEPLIIPWISNGATLTATQYVFCQ
jgi:hypothetical protein